MKRMTKKERERIDQILECLKREYGTEYTCYLTHKNAWQLLIATILSAQCTDARVNIVTKDLFVKYPDLESFAAADLKELEKDIHSTGFYHNKAKNIIACTKALVEEHQGEVPSDLESLTNPVKVEYELMKVLPEDFWILWNIHIIRLGRTICTARSPQCKECFLKELCKDYQARERRAARFTKKKAEA